MMSSSEDRGEEFVCLSPASSPSLPSSYRSANAQTPREKMLFALNSAPLAARKSAVQILSTGLSHFPVFHQVRWNNKLQTYGAIKLIWSQNYIFVFNGKNYKSTEIKLHSYASMNEDEVNFGLIGCKDGCGSNTWQLSAILESSSSRRIFKNWLLWTDPIIHRTESESAFI